MGQKSIILAIGLIIFAIILAAILVISRARSGSKTETKKDTKNPAAIVLEKTNEVKVIDVISDPLVYDGLNIEVEGNVSDWITKKSFTISSGTNQAGFFNSNNSNKKLLVIRSSDFKLPRETKGNGFALGDTGKVHIKGKARIINRKELSKLLNVSYDEKEKIIDDPDLIIDDGQIESWIRGSVIIINSIEKVQ